MPATVSREQLLVCRGDDFALVGGALPEVEADLAAQDSIAPLCEAARRLVGAPLTLTMRLFGEGQNLNVLHCDGATSQVDWQPLDQVEAFAGALWAKAVRSRGGAPWYQPAYHQRMLDFACERLAERRIRIDGPAQQIWVWPLSCIYRLPADGTSYWIKATRPRAFVPEGPVMSALSRVFPEYVPEPIAFVDDCTLFADFGARMAEDLPFEQVAPAFSALARIQLEGDELLELPEIQHWPLARLRSDLEDSRPFLGDEADALLARAERDIAELIAFGIGDHLAHGDFYWGNMALADGRLRIFDWSDVSSCHPFFDALYAMTPYDDAKSEALRRFYLGHWRGHAAADLEAAWPIAARIAPANNLVRNTRLLSYFEPWELSSCESDRLYWARRFRESYASPLATG